MVKEDQLIAHITDPFGSKVDDIYAPCKGLIVSIATIPLIRIGDPLVHLVPIKKTYERVKNAMIQDENVQCEEELVNDKELVEFGNYITNNLKIKNPYGSSLIILTI